MNNTLLRHITSDKSKSKFTFKENNVIHVTLKNDTKGKVKGIDNVEDSLIIEHVLLVNDLKYNLFSNDQLFDRSNMVIFEYLHCLVIHIIDKNTNFIRKRLRYTLILNEIDKDVKCFSGLTLYLAQKTWTC